MVCRQGALLISFLSDVHSLTLLATPLAGRQDARDHHRTSLPLSFARTATNPSAMQDARNEVQMQKYKFVGELDKLHNMVTGK